jgi:hypothetical protein
VDGVAEEWEDIDWLEDELINENDVMEDFGDKEKGIERNGCLSHLCQCAIKDSILQSPIATKLIRKVTSIVTYFSRSPLNYDKLKKSIGNFSLVRPCATRWNSQYHCLDRIFNEKRKEVD